MSALILQVVSNGLLLVAPLFVIAVGLLHLQKKGIAHALWATSAFFYAAGRAYQTGKRVYLDSYRSSILDIEKMHPEEQYAGNLRA